MTAPAEPRGPGSQRDASRYYGTLLVIALLIVLTIGLQILAGAYQTEFISDAASHYVSSLLVHDYFAAAFASGRFADPWAFIAGYHSAYPVVGIGHWGPAYYALVAVWMFLFGDSRTAVLILSATVSVSIALIVWQLVRARFGWTLGTLAGAATVVSPVLQPEAASLMVDGPTTLVCLLAMLAYVAYARRSRMLYAALFGLLATFGLMIKGNAACLALVPPIFVLIDNQWHWLRRPSFWVPAVIVIAVAGPWYWFTYHLVSVGFRSEWGWSYTSTALVENSWIMLTAFGPLALTAGIAGMVRALRQPGERASDPVLTGAVALLMAVFIFQAIVPCAIQARYLGPALPPLLLLAAYAVHALAVHVRHRHAIGAAAVLAVVSAAPWFLSYQQNPDLHLRPAVRQIWQHYRPTNPAVLIVAHNAAEGATVAELAMHDPNRPSLFAVRGSRLLGGGGYNWYDYTQKFERLEEVAAAIDSYAIPLVLLRRDETAAEWAHIAQVQSLADSQPDRWIRLYQEQDGPVSVILYLIKGHAARTADRERLRTLTAPRSLVSGK